MFESDKIMKNIEAWEPTLERSVDPEQFYQKLANSPREQELLLSKNIRQKAKEQQVKREEVINRFNDMMDQFHK